MPGLNYSIKVHKNEEKRLYRIMKELEFEGESLVEDAKGSEWHGTMRKLGVRAKPLIEKNLIEPIWIQRKPGNYMLENKLIRTKKSVSVKEVAKGNISEFYFKPKPIITDKKMHMKRRKLI